MARSRLLVLFCLVVGACGTPAVAQFDAALELKLISADGIHYETGSGWFTSDGFEGQGAVGDYDVDMTCQPPQYQINVYSSTGWSASYVVESGPPTQWIADLAVEFGETLRVGGIGSLAPAEVAVSEAIAPALLAMLLGVVLEIVLMQSWRHRSVIW